MRGRPPKPTKLKLIEGNPGKRPLPENEPTPEGVAELPKWLRPAAAEVWNEYAPHLIFLGLLTPIDAEDFGQYCDMAALFRTVGAAGMAANLIARMNSLSERFGMNPSARARMGTPRKPKDAGNNFAAVG